MENFYNTTIPPAVVRCITLGKAPSIQELCTVADHIGADLKGFRQTVPRSAARCGFPSSAIYRAAHAALLGAPDGGLSP